MNAILAFLKKKIAGPRGRFVPRSPRKFARMSPNKSPPRFPAQRRFAGPSKFPTAIWSKKNTLIRNLTVSQSKSASMSGNQPPKPSMFLNANLNAKSFRSKTGKPKTTVTNKPNALPSRFPTQFKYLTAIL